LPAFHSKSSPSALQTSAPRAPHDFPFRDFTEAGGMSYGSGFDDFRQVGIYTGRILKAQSRFPAK